MRGTSWFSLRRADSVHALVFGCLFHASVNTAPALDHSFAVVFFNKAKCKVMEFDERAAGFFTEPVLHIARDGIGYEEWADELEKCRALDSLDVRPKVAILIAEVAVPAATRPSFEYERHRALLAFAKRAELFEERLKSVRNGSAHVNFFSNAQGQIFDADLLCNFCCRHFSPFLVSPKSHGRLEVLFLLSVFLDLQKLMTPEPLECARPFPERANGHGVDAIKHLTALPSNIHKTYFL